MSRNNSPEGSQGDIIGMEYSLMLSQEVESGKMTQEEANKQMDEMNIPEAERITNNDI